MTDLDALAAAVAAYPDDDTPKLLLADWYDEHGEPAAACALRLAVLLRRVRTTPADDGPRLEYARVCEEYGRAERGEFIRVQCEIAAVGRMDAVRGKLVALRRRERELFDEHGLDWFDTPGLNEIRLTPATDRRSFGVVGRGFVDAVALPLAAFAGGACEHCDGGGYYRPPVTGGLAECRHCPGDGRVPGLAEALFRAHPVTAVTLSDRNPLSIYHDSRLARWLVDYEGAGDTPALIPPDVFRHLAGAPLGDWGADYPTREAALSDLSAACVLWGRTLAGLGGV